MIYFYLFFYIFLFQMQNDIFFFQNNLIMLYHLKFFPSKVLFIILISFTFIIITFL